MEFPHAEWDRHMWKHDGKIVPHIFESCVFILQKATSNINMNEAEF